MQGGAASAWGTDRLPPGVTVLGSTADYIVAVWQNVMILRVTGHVDRAFLGRALEGHHEALRYEPRGYGVVTIIERQARIPPLDIREEASRLRENTQEMLRAQAVILGGDGFFASAMRAVLTGILSMAKSRVPVRMMGSCRDAASFLAAWACNRTEVGDELEEVLEAIRAL